MIRSGVVCAANAASDAGVSSSIDSCVQVTRTIQVQLDPLSGCGACSGSGGSGGSGGCGVKLLPVVHPPLFVDCQLSDRAEVSVGDRIQIEIAEPDSDWLRIVALAYVSPTIGMIFGTLAGFWSARALHMPQFADGLSLAGLVIGLTGGLIAWGRAEKSIRLRQAGENRARLHKVIQER